MKDPVLFEPGSYIYLSDKPVGAGVEFFVHCEFCHTGHILKSKVDPRKEGELRIKLDDFFKCKQCGLENAVIVDEVPSDGIRVRVFKPCGDCLLDGTSDCPHYNDPDHSHRIACPEFLFNSRLDDRLVTDFNQLGETSTKAVTIYRKGRTTYQCLLFDSWQFLILKTSSKEKALMTQLPDESVLRALRLIN